MIGETWNSGVAGNRKWQAAGFFFFLNFAGQACTVVISVDLHQT
jgi:hypothetical protein